MIRLSRQLESSFTDALKQREVAPNQIGYHLKWLRYYLDFCNKYEHEVGDADSLGEFLKKLSDKGQSAFLQKQASRAVGVYYELRRAGESSKEVSVNDKLDGEWDDVMARLKQVIQTKHYSKTTLRTYATWSRKFREFTERKPVEEIDASDAANFFTHLATQKRVAASTQNQAFNALLFLFRHVLKKEYEGFEGVVRAKTSKYIPVVLTREEIDQVLSYLKHPYNLILKLLYGCGLRRFEVVNIRVSCLNFDAGMLTIHDGKGKKDRTVPLPVSLIPDLKRQVRRVAYQLEMDLSEGFDGAFMPDALSRKFRSAAKELPWQWLFPARNLTLVPETEELRRYHQHETKIGDVIRAAARKARLTKRVTAHTFRHSYASHLLQANYDIRTIQQLLGHSDVKTTMIYTHTVPVSALKEPVSPLDF